MEELGGNIVPAVQQSVPAPLAQQHGCAAGLGLPPAGGLLQELVPWHWPPALPPQRSEAWQEPDVMQGAPRTWDLQCTLFALCQLPTNWLRSFASGLRVPAIT